MEYQKNDRNYLSHRSAIIPIFILFLPDKSNPVTLSISNKNMEENDTYARKSGKFQKFMEWIWLFIAFISLGTWIYSLQKEGETDSNMLLIISAVSFLMYFLRRYLDKKKKS